MTSQLRILLSLARPIGQPLRGSRVLSRESVRRVVRSYFVSSGFTSELVLGMPCAGSVPPSKPGRPQKNHFRASAAPSRSASACRVQSGRIRARGARKKTKGASHRCETPSCERSGPADGPGDHCWRRRLDRPSMARPAANRPSVAGSGTAMAWKLSNDVP